MELPACRRNSFTLGWNSTLQTCSALSFIFSNPWHSTQGMARPHVHCQSHKNGQIWRKNSFCLTNVDWTPYLQDATTVWDLGVKKSIKKTLLSFSQCTSHTTLGPHVSPNIGNQSRMNVRLLAKVQKQWNVDWTPLLEDGTPLEKTRSAGMFIFTAHQESSQGQAWVLVHCPGC